MGFVCRGVLEKRALSKDDETIMDFIFPGSLICDHVSLLTELPSDTSIVALEKSEMLVISKASLETLYEKRPQYQKLGRLITGQFYVENALRIRERKKPVLERYENLLRLRPELKKILQYKIASFLGITPEWLSKITKK